MLRFFEAFFVYANFPQLVLIAKFDVVIFWKYSI